MPTRKDRRGLMPTRARSCVKLFSPCAPKYRRYTKAGMPILTTTPARCGRQQLGPTPVWGRRHRKPRPQRLLEESLEQRRHCAHPERMDDIEMLGPADGLLG